MVYFLSTGNLPRGSFESHSMGQEDFADDLIILLGDSSAEHVKYRAGILSSDSVYTTVGLPMCLYWRHEHLHVRVRCNQVLFTAPDGCSSTVYIHRGSIAYDSIQHYHREHCRHLGSVWKQVSFLCGQQRSKTADNSVTLRLA